MYLGLGDVAPDFSAESTIGAIDLYEYLGDHWGLLLSHTADHTPAGTTEPGRTALLQESSRKEMSRP